MLILAACTAATRLTVMAAYPGEPDSALFPLGLWRWMTAGPLSTRVYDRQFSPGYYWLAAHLALWLQVEASGFIHLLNQVSFWAALAAAPLVYAVSRDYLPAGEAFWASLAWLLSPAVWWLGIEPHPQMLGIALSLTALWAHRRAVAARHGAVVGLAWWAGAFVALLSALLVRADAVFLFAVFFLPWLPGPGGKQAGGRPRISPARGGIATTVMLGLAAAGFWLLRALLTGSWRGAPPSEPGTAARIMGFLGQLSPVHQILPFFTAAGLILTLLAVAGWWTLARAERWRWTLVVAIWLLPGGLFWFLVRGNNTRHVAIYLLPVLWAGAAGWSRWRIPGRSGFRRAGRASVRAVAWVAAAGLILDFALPASPNLSLYPSGDVPLSAALLRRRERQLFAFGAELTRAPAGQCYLGSYTSPYVLWGALRAYGLGNVRIAGDLPVTRVTPTGGAAVTFHDVYSASGYRAAASACPHPSSFEYAAHGRRLHPMGLPGWRSWW